MVLKVLKWMILRKSFKSTAAAGGASYTRIEIRPTPRKRIRTKMLEVAEDFS